MKQLNPMNLRYGSTYRKIHDLLSKKQKQLMQTALSGSLACISLFSFGQIESIDDPCKPLILEGPEQSYGQTEEVYFLYDNYACGNQGYRWKFDGAKTVNGIPADNFSNHELISPTNEIHIQWKSNVAQSSLTASTVDGCGRPASCDGSKTLVITLLSEGVGNDGLSGKPVEIISPEGSDASVGGKPEIKPGIQGSGQAAAAPLTTAQLFGVSTCVFPGSINQYTMSVEKAHIACGCTSYIWTVTGGTITNISGVPLNVSSPYTTSNKTIYIKWNETGNSEVKCEAKRCCINNVNLTASKQIPEVYKGVSTSMVGTIQNQGTRYDFQGCLERVFVVNKPSYASFNWKINGVTSNPNFQEQDYGTYTALVVKEDYLACNKTISCDIWNPLCGNIIVSSLNFNKSYRQVNTIQLTSSYPCRNSDYLELTLSNSNGQTIPADQYYKWTILSGHNSEFIDIGNGGLLTGMKTFESTGSINRFKAYIKPNGDTHIEVIATPRSSTACLPDQSLDGCAVDVFKVINLPATFDPVPSFTLNGSTSSTISICGSGSSTPLSSLVLDGSASTDETSYKIDIVSNSNQGNIHFSQTFNGAVPSNLNLASLQAFTPNRIYQITLTVINECTPGISLTKEVKIIGLPSELTPYCALVDEDLNIRFMNVLDGEPYEYEIQSIWTSSTIVFSTVTVADEIALSAAQVGSNKDVLFVAVSSVSCPAAGLKTHEIPLYYDNEVWPTTCNTSIQARNVEPENDPNVPAAKKHQVTIVPNPGSGIFRLQGISESTRIEIFDIYGIPVYKGSATTIDLSNQIEGVYFLHSYNGDFHDVQQLIIQK